MDCLFCKIAKGEIKSKKIYEDKKVLAFYDVNPQAPIHILVIPKEHVESLSHLDEENANITAHIFLVIKKLMEDLGVTNGYRVVNNCGENGGQTVNHLHFHVMAGRKFEWPAG